MIRVCLCPTSLNWIRKHLKRSALATFNRMINKNTRSDKTTKRKTKRRRGKKQPWMVKGSASAKRHMARVRRARR